MPQPYFLTAWEREDHERQKCGQRPLGPLGGQDHRMGWNEAIEAAAKTCENMGHSNGRIRASHAHVAAAIRALAQPS